MNAGLKRRIIQVTEDAIYFRDPKGLFERICDIAAWRDVDSGRNKLGVTIWPTGGEIHLGKRLYRVRWWS